ncbi:hypothetical protein SDC9_09025 [bioreactor metagenome]|uniref:Peptidase M50 domain-containing protein n=1 Tax=bioreactor metagenome TaxID=1076179 RepID=A0A644T914_9ZZZZ|nr:M50 family metallopeptidase [Negativicutes bacterium]
MVRGSDGLRAGKISGIQIILNNWFIVLIVLFACVGLATKALAVFGAVLVHEFAHALMAMILGFKVREIELLPFGGVARIERMGEAGSSGEIMIAAAGPIISLVLAALMYMGIEQFPIWAEEFCFFYQINIMLALFNLIPGLPLDGGRILRAWLAHYRDYGKATMIAASVSNITAVVLVGISGFDYWQSGTINLTFLVAAVFLYVAAKTEVQVAGFRQMRVLARKKAELTVKGVMPARHYTAMYGARAHDIIHLFGPDYYHIVLVVDDNFRLQGTLTETEVWEALPYHGLYAKIGKFL